MAKKKNTAAAKGIVLLVIVGVPALFVLASMGTSTLMDQVPYIGVAIAAVAIGIYTGFTCHLLYEYFETGTPFDSYLPCVGELSLMDSKYKGIGYVFYIVALAFFGISRLPYAMFSFLGESLALNMPFYAVVGCFVALGIVQVIKGIGILNLMKHIEGEWDDKMHGTLGFIKFFGFLGFIPFVRVVATYGLNKPLSTLVSFNSLSVSDTDEVELSEE